MMTLKNYKDNNKLSYHQLAEMLSCSKSRAYDLCKNQGGDIRLTEVVRIIEATDGAVTFTDFGIPIGAACHGGSA